MINNYLVQAELSLAAYSTLSSGTPSVSALTDNGQGMAVPQAQRFASGWRVVDQYNHSEQIPTYDGVGNLTGYLTTSNGLSVTVFQEVASGKKYLAIRGTDDVADLATDLVDIAIFGTPNLQTQYASLKSKVQEWMASGTLPSSFPVSGHSLGGFLAGALLIDFPLNVERAYLYNAPGIGGAGATLGLFFRNLMGLASDPSLDLARVSNLKALAGTSLIAGLGVQLDTPIGIAIEDQFLSDIAAPPAARNHSQQVLTDSLAIYAAYGALAPSLSTEQIGTIFRTASDRNQRTLENSLDALRSLLGLAGATPTEDREALYTNLYSLQESASYRALAGGTPLRLMTDLSVESLASQAKQDFGHFLAVQYLLPVAIEGAPSTIIEAHAGLYDRWQADRAKRIAGTQDLEFSDSYLADRAEMLSWKPFVPM